MVDAAAVEPKRDFRRTVVIVLVALAGALLAYLIGTAVLPRWWARRIGNVVDGRMTIGATFGVVLGFVFTMLPLAVLWAALRWRRGWQRWLGFLLAALLLAIPNLLTLGVVLGGGSSSHAGERILDVDGPGFRAGTLVGVIAGVVAFIALAYLVRSRRTSRRRADELHAQLHAADDSEEPS